VVLPLQLGMAEPARARRSLERIEREWVNRWGLVHTRGHEELVWTLPTGLLALTAFRYDKPDLALRLLQNIAETASYGTLGAFKELIPVGLCFVQLWSAGLYAQGIIEGMLGLNPLAHQHQLSIAPCLPSGWPRVRLSALAIGAHTLTVEIWPDGLDIQHISGPEPLDLRYRLPAGVTALEHSIPYGKPPELITNDEGRCLQIMLAPGQRIIARASAERLLVHVPDRREEPVGERVTG
jgi:Glycosyl hydrolase family 65, C-terminal domain